MSVVIRIVITSQYGQLSRGRHSARRVIAGDTAWAEKTAHGNLVVTEPGIWWLHCTDGYNREARAVLVVTEDGDWEMTGATGRFTVLED